MINVNSLARVILKRGQFVGYRHLEDEEEECFRLNKIIKLDPDEEILGIYRNDPPGDADSIVVTTTGLRLLRFGQASDVIRYDNIESVAETRPADKTDTEISIRLLDGTTKQVSVRGQRGQFMDVFEFLRFLMRAVDRVKDQSE